MAFAWITVAAMASLSLQGVDAATTPPAFSPTTSPYSNSTKPGLQLTTDANCTCFRTNSSTANYFSHHSFFDFRTMGEYVHTPPVLQDSQANINAPATNTFFSSANWTNMWQAQNWDNGALMKANNSDVTGSDATLYMVNSPNNIYIEHNSDVLGKRGVATRDTPTYMVMRTARLNAFQTSAEIESSSTGYRFLSVRMYARTVGAPGAITAMFTYRPGANNALNLVQESDLEIRTRDPATRVQFTNQPSWNADGDIPQATRNVTMPGGNRWNDWAHYRMDWTPGSTTWYVDGQLASTITFQAPRDASQVMFNSWSDGGTWSGNMSANGAAFLQIQWIEMVFNNTDAAYMPKSGGCTNMCSIDETPVTGTPVLVASGGRSSGDDGDDESGGAAFSMSMPMVTLTVALVLCFIQF